MNPADEDDTRWAQEQQRDEELQQQRLLQALKAAERAGTPHEEVIELAAGLGLIHEYSGTKTQPERT